MTGGTVLRLDALSKSFGGLRAVSDLSFAVQSKPTVQEYGVGYVGSALLESSFDINASGGPSWTPKPKS